MLAALPGCAPSYSPDTYATNATQQANKVDQGVIVGVRPVKISVDATLGSATGAAAGGIAGSQIGGGGPVTALSALSGTVAGGVVGNVVSHAAGDTDGFEYIVKKTNGDMLSVTQKDVTALGIGAHVLIIEGPQARVVADYTVPLAVPPQQQAEASKTAPPVPPSSPATAPTPSPGAITSSPLPPPDPGKKPESSETPAVQAPANSI